MDFLSYNKDILFEISRYLSIVDLKMLKFAFPTINIKSIFLDQKKLHYKPDGFYDASSIIQDIFDSDRDKFLLYNRRYEKNILYVDIDYRAVNQIYHIYTGDKQAFTGITVLDFGVLIKIRNGLQWLKNVEPTDLLDTEYIRQVIYSGKLIDYIEDNLEFLSHLENYISYNISFRWDILSWAKYVFVIWISLPRENRIKLKEEIEIFLQSHHQKKYEAINGRLLEYLDKLI